MSRIFISYASEDRERARILAQALEQRGWPVWWDREIPLGKVFDEVIEENLARAQCVLVLWSKASVGSRWVRSEASAAAARGVLIPVLLEQDIDIPLQFRLLHAADLSSWEGDAAHPEFQSFSAHIESMLNAEPGAVAGTATEDGVSQVPGRAQVRNVAATERTRVQHKASSAAKLRNALLFIFLPTAFIGVTTVALMLWHLPTRIQLELVVERMSFTLADDQQVEFPARPLSFRALTVENFDAVRFTPQHFVRGADSDASPTGPGPTSPGDPGQELTLQGAIDGTPVLDISSTNNLSSGAGQLEQIVLNPQTEVILQTSIVGDHVLMIRVDGQSLATSVLPAWENLGEQNARVALDLSATDTSLVGTTASGSGRDLHLREVTLAPHAPTLFIEGARDMFAIIATLGDSKAVQLGAGLRIGEVDFFKLRQSGELESSLVAPGKIAYRDYPDIKPVLVNQFGLVDASALRDVKLVRLILDPQQSGLDLLLEGVAEKRITGTGLDYRLTVFDTLWHGPRATMLLAILVWAFSVSVGAYRLYREVTIRR